MFMQSVQTHSPHATPCKSPVPVVKPCSSLWTLDSLPHFSIPPLLAQPIPHYGTQASFQIPSQECFLSSGEGIQGIHLAFVLCQPLGHHCDLSKHKTCCRFVSSCLLALSLQIDINIQDDFQGQYICEILEQRGRLTCVWGRRCLRLFGQGRHLGNGHWNNPREE